MKIGIITHWNSLDNYGQQMQCWALQTYLRGLGHEPFLIKYLPATRKEPLWRKIGRSVKWRLFMPSEKRRKYYHTKNIYENNKRQNPRRDFEGFRKANLASTDVVYQSIDELRANPPQADAYITGSDQVWLDPLSNPNTAASYLDFGSAHAKRISYAASMGRDLAEEELEQFGKYLTRFDAVSVRERKACEFCHRVGRKDAIVTIDPTLLLDAKAYSSIKSSSQDSLTFCDRYAFFYLLNICSADDVYWDVFRKQIATDGLQVRAVAASGYLPAQEFLPGIHNELATIPQWLSLLQHAEYVVTSSFHGVVFSLLYHKPFYAVLLKGRFAKANDRIFTLLKTAGLENRIISSAQDIPACHAASIDWNDVDERLAKLRKESEDFIKQALRK